MIYNGELYNYQDLKNKLKNLIISSTQHLTQKYLLKHTTDGVQNV